jgi:hypothetical protein
METAPIWGRFFLLESSVLLVAGGFDVALSGDTPIVVVDVTEGGYDAAFR